MFYFCLEKLLIFLFLVSVLYVEDEKGQEALFHWVSPINAVLYCAVLQVLPTVGVLTFGVPQQIMPYYCALP